MTLMLLAFAIYCIIDCVYTYPISTTFVVTLNLSSSACPPNASKSCYNAVLNDLTEFKSVQKIEYVFQSGTHILSKKDLKVGYAKNLTVHGQVNATIKCATESVRISFITAPYIMLKGLEFQNCKNVIIQNNSVAVTVDIFNCTFSNSCLLFFAKSRNLTAMRGDYIVSSLMLQMTDVLMISGYNSSEISITCIDTEVYIRPVPKSVTTLSDLHVLGCNNTQFYSKAKNVTVTVTNSKFIKSCLKFISKHTGSSDIHTYRIIINHTTIQECFCRSVLQIDKVEIQFHVIINDGIISNNSSPFLKSQGVGVSITIVGNNSFYCNKDFIFHIDKSTISFAKAEVYFINNTVNSAIQGTPIYATNSWITFEDCSVMFSHNQGSLSGGITIGSTPIIFKDNATVTFSGNTGLNGGALSLYTRSRLTFNASQSNSTLVFENNTAAHLGGAIYVDDNGYTNIESIFDLQCDSSYIKVKFGYGNVASFSGNQIYGGWIDWFVDKELNNTPRNDRNRTNQFVEVSDSDVTSNPIRICLCMNNKPNCSATSSNHTIYGHALDLELVGVGQRFTPVISVVTHNSKLNSVIIPKLTSLQSACTKIKYDIKSETKEEMITLEPYLPHLYYGSHSATHDVKTHNIVGDLFHQLTIKLKFNECPQGFYLNNAGYCNCQLSIQRLCLSCDISNYTIRRSGQQWVGTTHEHDFGDNNSGIVAHQHCPFDYCRTDNSSLSIRLENQDVQCAFNREGILCGGCKENLSRVLGTSNCLECTNKYILLIVITWLISGLILVICLMLLNLTVSVGTINGLMFYANIIRAQHTTFFTPNISNSFLSIFIAWLNLDTGIEMCLYDGLDSYVITWLQYVYPLYIWLIAVIIIILSHYSSRISKFCGKNAVQVLATLFLISYARLIRLMIEVFSFTWITYSDGHKKAVWLVDGNYEFFKGKLIPLILVTVIFILLSLPYAFILLTIQFLHKISHYCILFWVQRLKPFFDAYTGPYKSRHRYWTGLLLVARIALLITFSVNQSNNLSINLLAIITVSVVLLGWLSSANWVYNSPLNNFLEIIFLGNLGLTSAAVLFNISNGKSSPAAIYLSTSVAFALFIFIVLYHIYRRLVLSKLSSKLAIKVMQVLPIKNVTNTNIDSSTSGHNEVTSTMVELNQPYSHMYDSYNSHDLKEPLLEEPDDK